MDSSASIECTLQQKDSCYSHVSVYYEQNQHQEERIERQAACSCSSEEKVVENPPVEIRQENTISIDLPPLTWHGYDTDPRILTVTNTGRTIIINGHWSNSRPYIEGGPLNGTYLFSQIHFHCPSEHEIDGKRYPLEMHIVHYKTSYLTQERAMNEKDGTVVLVYLFQLMDACETVMSSITKLAPQLGEVNSRTESTEIPFDRLIRPFMSNYYVYWGSVTTKKKCYLLQWIINCSVFGVTKQEVEDLSSIITYAIGASIKQGPRVKPENDAIYHVGEDDYSLPVLKTLSADDVCCVCKCHEGSSGSLLICNCKSRTRIFQKNCKIHKGRQLCSRCKSIEIICRKCKAVGEGSHTGKYIRSRQSKKKKSKMDVEEALSEGELLLNDESANGSSISSLLDEIPSKPKKRQKGKKTRGKSKKSSDGESEKSSSKSSMGDDKSRVKFEKDAEKGEPEQTPDSESKQSSKVTEKPKKNADSQELLTESDRESEKESAESKEKKGKKKKKKNEVQIVESVYSQKETSSKQMLKAGTEFTCSDANGLLSLSLKSSAHDEETERNLQISESKSLANTEATVQSPSTCSSDREIKKENPCKDDALKSPLVSRCLKSRSKSRIRLKDRESSERKTALDSAARSSKSKSPLADSPTGKRKVSMRKGSEQSNSKSKVSICESNTSEVEKNKNLADCNLSRSVQEMKCPVTKSTDEIENLKGNSKSPRDVKIRNSKLRNKESSKLIISKSKEKRKGKNEANSGGKKSKQDYDITTLFEKKPDGRKGRSFSGDCKDVTTNFLLTPTTTVKSTPSCTLTTSDSDFMEEKKGCEDEQKKQSHFVQDFTVNTATFPEVEFPQNKLKEISQVCLMMEHIFHTEHEGNVCRCSSQEYHVAVWYDQSILQEYRGKFHPQELQLGDYEVLQLVPKYPNLENSNFRLQDCSVKKESLDEICIRVKFLVKELNVRKIFESTESGHYETSEKQEKLLLHQETQCNGKEFYSAQSQKTIGANKKPLHWWNSEILLSEPKSKNEEKQEELPKSEEKQDEQPKGEEEQNEQPKNEEKLKRQLKSGEKLKQQSKSGEKLKQRPKSGEKLRQQPKSEEKLEEQPKSEEGQNEQLKFKKKHEEPSENKSLHWEWGPAEPQRCTAKPQSDSDVSLQDVSQSTVTEGFSTDSNLQENKMWTTYSESNDKKLKPLFVKRRKTVYFVYDKVEKDESTGKKVFVGSFKTKEEVDNLKKQREFFQENEAEKSEEISEAKYSPAFEYKETSWQVAKPEESPAVECSSHFPSTSQDASSYQKKDVVTLHKYQPKYPEINRSKKVCKNVMIGKASDNIQVNRNNSKNLGNIVNAAKEKARKMSVYKPQDASKSESPKEKPNPDSSKSEEKIKAKNAALTKGQVDHSQAEVIVPEKSNTAEEDSARDNSQKSLDKKESQAALILMPVEVESLSKFEVILIEHLESSK